ncbi:uncharacterized protein [Spinacia oleracea]|uniref:MULE transposase domain-containing protein n=1 Tax=Spinacia oleracea TaxID=3562 RepID=A0ABM3R3E3_SPIOL|nr:uncharacterized protein LOC130465416 [Spinacia oleracea]
MYELKTSNVGTSVFQVLKPHISRSIPQFHIFYINFVALRQGFLHGCRRVLGLYGAFLKGYCKGELLSATTRDANNQMFPVAWAIVESESKERLVPVIPQLLPKVEHRLCARHIFTNWTKIIKGAPLHKLYWRAVKAYTKVDFEDAMQELKQQSPKAYEEMCARNVNKFCRFFYKTWESNITCTNMAETFNSWILEAREKPILTMLEEIRRQVMSRMVDKKSQVAKGIGIVTPQNPIAVEGF